MKLKMVIFITFLFSALFSQNLFTKYFHNQTLRIDYYHIGTKTDEEIVKDKLYVYDYLSINPSRLIDDMNLGNYLLKVIDISTNRLIYSHGVSTLFNEWQTTPEATAGHKKVIPESFLIPLPKNKIIIQLWKRDKTNHFTEMIGQFTIDPQKDELRKDSPYQKPLIHKIIHNGRSQNKVDLIILGDGYTKAEWGKFKKDAEKMTRTLMSVEPFASNKKKFNITAVLLPSQESGTDIPGTDIWKRNVLGTRFYTFGLERYMMTFENAVMRDIAGSVPYDFIQILVNTDKYGGGGIFGLYAVTAADAPMNDYIFIHEFGHHFGGLGDEYYTSNVTYSDFYREDIEPWEPNVTALHDPENIKWKQFVTEGTPIPTPWLKSKFDSASAAHAGNLKEIMHNDPYFGKIGAFEGSGYSSTGLYRPAIDCIMFSRGIEQGFDPVCQHAILNMINFYTTK